VHAKHLIVDDSFSLIGSANINDRSMAGDRDTEIGVVTHEEGLVSGMLSGWPTPRGYCLVQMCRV
jgi:phospholipase D1/2